VHRGAACSPDDLNCTDMPSTAQILPPSSAVTCLSRHPWLATFAQCQFGSHSCLLLAALKLVGPSVNFVGETLQRCPREQPQQAASAVVGLDMVVTEKLDGGNCCIKGGQVFARTHSKIATHWSFDTIKGLVVSSPSLPSEKSFNLPRSLLTRGSCTHTSRQHDRPLLSVVGLLSLVQSLILAPVLLQHCSLALLFTISAQR
jgi:hypothetical protein